MDNPKRRLADKIIDAHEMACNKGSPEVAEHLMRALEADLSDFGGERRERRNVPENVGDAFERHRNVKPHK